LPDIFHVIWSFKDLLDVNNTITLEVFSKNGTLIGSGTTSIANIGDFHDTAGTEFMLQARISKCYAVGALTNYVDSQQVALYLAEILGFSLPLTFPTPSVSTTN
jgi:hypothetical protein